METAVLSEVRAQIEALYLDRGEDFSLSTRYKALLNLEASLIARLNEPLSSYAATR
jgi:hypothetical protein